MPGSRKKLARAISAATGRSHSDAVTVLAAALRGEEWAAALVRDARARLAEDRAEKERQRGGS